MENFTLFRGHGRIDVVGHSGVDPGSGPYPSGPAESRTPAGFVHGQTDEEGRPVEDRSEPIYFEGKFLLGGTTPKPSGPATSPKRRPTLKSARRAKKSTKGAKKAER